MNAQFTYHRIAIRDDASYHRQTVKFKIKTIAIQFRNILAVTTSLNMARCIDTGKKTNQALLATLSTRPQAVPEAECQPWSVSCHADLRDV